MDSRASSGELRSQVFGTSLHEGNPLREADPLQEACQNNPGRIQSCLCTQAQLESEPFRRWARSIGETAGHLHRKIWEWCYIAQGLAERDMLRPGRRGLGFAVGEEPLASLFAGAGCAITATDLDLRRAAGAGWVKTGQHAHNLTMLNTRGLCPAAEFDRRVEFRYADMNRIPPDLREYDFLWSACSLEHLGSLSLGEQFIYNSLACLRRGGVAVHTTEFNVSSNSDTVDYRSTVLFRRRDLERMAETLTACGQTIVPFTFDTGDLPADRVVDVPPYDGDRQLKVLLRRKYVCTSVGFMITKTSDTIPQAPKAVTPPTWRSFTRPAEQWLRSRLRLLRSAADDRQAA
jgi:hypothetical protein